MNKTTLNTRHGDLLGRLTNQQVHAYKKSNGHDNLFLNSKNKIMSHKNKNVKTKSLLFVAIFGFLTVFIVGCQKDDDIILSHETETSYHAKLSSDDLIVNLDKVDESIKQDAIAYYGKVITIADFPKEKILSISYEEKINQSISKSDIGGSPKNALVALEFDANKVLYTPKRLNDFSNSTGNNSKEYSELLEYFVDINTYREVTGIKEANHEYAQSMPNKKGELIWTFDPYVKFFEKNDVKEKRMETFINKLPQLDNKIMALSTSTVPVWGKKGVILYGEFAGGWSDYSGHTAGVVQEIAASYTTTVAKMYNTYIVEALKSDGVNKKRMTNSSGTSNWNESGVISNRSAVWLSSLTTTQRNSIASYQIAQVGEPYYFSVLTSEKNRTDRWYCSKLQWKAYLQATGIDIDDDGGAVYPRDIAYNPIMMGYSFWLLS